MKNYMYFGNLEVNTIKQTEIKKKTKKREPQKNMKASRN